MIVPKENVTAPNIFMHMKYGCDTFPRHKTGHSKHCEYHGLLGNKLIQAIEEYRKHNQTVISTVE